MYLKALEMQGFKSFPDKIVLNFGKGVTAVVGPNGSGKSNISDAVRWVLGEQSTKSLRGSKMEDVIFSGTKDRRPQGFAEVTLKLDNSDSALNNPEKEVSVTRRYYRSGDSSYLINGSTVRLKDVHELFMDTGLGRDGYSMVGQGRIEEMVSAKSENRRDMLEEAAGISAFRYRRGDALKKLEQAEENLVRLRDIVTELQSRVGPLEKQSIKAQQFLVYAAEKKDLEIGLWVNILSRSAGQIREQGHRIEIARSQYESAGEAIEALKDGDTVLIAEGCTHHRQCDDIGTVKIPAWLRKYTGKNITIKTCSGTEFPDDLTPYALVIHCGGCMLNEREVRYRTKCAADQQVPITNYGTLIAYINGILKPSLSLFPGLLPE